MWGQFSGRLYFLFSALNFFSPILMIHILYLIDASLLQFKGFHIASLSDTFIIRAAKQLDLVLSVFRIRNNTFLSFSSPIKYGLVLEVLSETEAVVQKCSVKKMFLEISQNLQENTRASVSFLIKLQAIGLQFC